LSVAAPSHSSDPLCGGLLHTSRTSQQGRQGSSSATQPCACARYTPGGLCTQVRLINPCSSMQATKICRKLPTYQLLSIGLAHLHLHLHGAYALPVTPPCPDALHSPACCCACVAAAAGQDHAWAAAAAAVQPPAAVATAVWSWLVHTRAGVLCVGWLSCGARAAASRGTASLSRSGAPPGEARVKGRGGYLCCSRCDRDLVVDLPCGAVHIW
jgi:hypothetical protein